MKALTNHIEICLSIFNRFLTQKVSVLPDNAQLPQNLAVIYGDCNNMLRNLVAGGFLPTAGTGSTVTAMGMMQDLILVTSRLYTAALEHKPLKKLCSAGSVCVALAPYWALTCLATQLDSTRSQAGLFQLLSSKIAMQAAMEVEVELSMISKEKLQTNFTHPLLYLIQLVLATRTSLETKIRSTSTPANAPFFQSILLNSDRNSIELVAKVARLLPQLCMCGDPKPLVCVASFKSLLHGDAEWQVSASRLPIELVKVLSKVAVSMSLIDQALRAASSSGHNEVANLLSALLAHAGLQLKEKHGEASIAVKTSNNTESGAKKPEVPPVIITAETMLKDFSDSVNSPRIDTDNESLSDHSSVHDDIEEGENKGEEAEVFQLANSLLLLHRGGSPSGSTSKRSLSSSKGVEEVSCSSKRIRA